MTELDLTPPFTSSVPASLAPDLHRVLPTAPLAYEVAGHTDPGNERPNNEDCFGVYEESQTSAVLAVADGVGGYEGGELASQMAVELTLQSYREQPKAHAAAKRIFRAAQHANIEIYDRAIVVPDLRHMCTTLTAVAVERGVVHAAHVGDTRLYLLRDGRIRQMSKDHTVAAQRQRLGLLSEKSARSHPERSTLTRSLGSELIAAIDRITFPLLQGDTLIVCTDGMHSILEDQEMAAIVQNRSALGASRTLIETANQRGTVDNVTAVVFRMVGETPPENQATTWRQRVRVLLGA
jgi:PPM family protein phosphatase